MSFLSDLREVASKVEGEFEIPSSSELASVVGALLHKLETEGVNALEGLGSSGASSPPAASESGEGGDAPTAQPSPSSSSTWGGQ